MSEQQLIADFMDFDLETASKFSDKPDYSTSWDWLIPVVEKISEIKNDDAHVYWNRGDVIDIRIFRESIGVTYTAVVSFINWYNTFHPNNKQTL